MRIKEILCLLNEYNSSKTNTTLAGLGGEKASGKNYDNIITGKAKPYKATKYETKYAKVFPRLAEIVRKLKTQAVKSDIIVIGSAAAELQNLLKGYRPKQTPQGDYSLPFGDNIRLKQRAGAFFIGYNNPDALPSRPADLTNDAAPAFNIVK